MKEIEISKNLFNQIIKMVCKITAKDDSRPILKKIQCKVDEKNMTFIALDGYMATKCVIEHKNPNVESFNFTFYPFIIESTNKDISNIKIAYTDEQITFTYLDKQGNKSIKEIKNIDDNFVNYDQIRSGYKQECSKIYLDIRNLYTVLTSLKNSQERYIELSIGNPTSPMFVTSKILEEGNIEYLILPIRKV